MNIMIQTDEKLVDEYLSGDEQSWEELLRRTLKPVFNFVYQYVRDTETTDDLVQETFLKAWKNLRKFEQQKKWKPWIFAIARNTALDHLKKIKPIPFSLMNSPGEADPDYPGFGETLEDTEPLANELFENSQNIHDLTEAISSLRPEYHSVILLHYYQEMTFEETSKVMGMPMNTVKSWHYRALREIRAILMTKNKHE